MRVLFVHAHSNIIAGQEISLFNRIVGLQKAGVNCLVVMPKRCEFSKKLANSGIEVKFIALNRFFKKTFFLYLYTVIKIFFTIVLEKIDIVHCSKKLLYIIDNI